MRSEDNSRARERVRANLRKFYFSNEGIEQCLSQATPRIVSFLDRLMEDELERREANRRRRILRGAGFPSAKRIEEYDFSCVRFPPELPKEAVCSLDFVRDKHSLVLYGVCGSGKTMLATCLGLAACRQGMRVRFFTLPQLCQRLSSASEAGRLQSCLEDLRKLDLLIIDEFGYCQIDRQSAQLLFQVVADSYERKSLIVTTNLPFSQWGKVVTDEQLATAIIDRIVHYGHLVDTGERDWRLSHSPMNGIMQNKEDA